MGLVTPTPGNYEIVQYIPRNMCFVVFCSDSVWLSFNHILQGYFTAIGEIIQRSQYYWTDLKIYRINQQRTRLFNK